MFYTIYKTTNIVNGKFYIGKHQTKDLNDGYLGSGKLLKRAIKKYGIENFHKEILFECRSEEHMNTLEKILVVPDPELNYNLCDGGKGGFGYINSFCHNNKNNQRKTGNYKFLKQPNKESKLYREKLSSALKKKYNEGFTNGFKGKKHSEKFRQRMSSLMQEKQKGINNSQFGTCWVNNGIQVKKIKKQELDFYLGLGYLKGRIMEG
jgi:hypothetical protein